MTHPSTTQTRELVVPGRVERRAKRQKRSKRIGLVVLIGLALTVGVAGKALAWHVLPGEAKRTCKTLTLSTVVPKADWFTGTATLTFKGAADSRTTPGPLSVTVPFDKSEPAGAASGEVTWTDSNETEQVLASYGKAPEGCTPPTTTTTAPPAKEKPKPVFHGTATNKKRTPTTTPTTTPKKEVKPPPVTRTTPGVLPFTGPEDGAEQVHPDRMMFLFFLGLLGIGLVTTGRILLIKARLHRSKEGEQG